MKIVEQWTNKCINAYQAAQNEEPMTWKLALVFVIVIGLDQNVRKVSLNIILWDKKCAHNKIEIELEKSSLGFWIMDSMTTLWNSIKSFLNS